MAGIGLVALVGVAAVAAVHWGASGGVAGGRADHAMARPSSAAASAASAASAAASMPFAFPTAASAAAVTPRLRSVEDLEALLASAPRDDRVALSQLAPAWQFDAGHADPCVVGAAHGVGCYRTHGGLALLRLLARPSVLALRDGQDRPVYVVLVGLGRDDATLLVGKTPLEVPISLLTTSWRGDFSTLWRLPVDYAVPLMVGARGPQVDRLAAQLAALQGVPAPAPGTPFDAALKARVMAFQQAQGLTADGVAGQTTLMQINRASGVVEPWLAGVAAQRK